MSNMSQSACYRCREQKLKCSRDLPVCERCDRLGAGCSYPDPPDRKQIASTRARPRKRQRQDVNATSLEQGFQGSTLPAIPHSDVENSDEHFIATESQSFSDISILPQSLETLLQDIYFTYIFNSSITVHRIKFNEAIEQGQLPDYVKLAMYALSLKFFKPPCTLAQGHEQDILYLGDTQVLGRQWAEDAGKQCLPTIDQPTLYHIQTCQMLGLYWFSQGETIRNTMFSGIAYKACRTLIIDLEQDEKEDWVLKETRRRCFWAAFTTYCINGDHYVVGTSNDSLVMKTPLPISEVSFIHMIQEVRVTLSDIEASRTHTRQGGEPNMWAEIMRLVLHWAKIRDYIETRKSLTMKESMAQLLSLEDWLIEFNGNLNRSLVYSKDILQTQIKERRSLGLFLLHTIYHQCRLVLHSSLVPHFNGQILTQDISRSMVRTSAQIAVDSAKALSSLAADIISLEIDLARMAPFVSHCMYVSASIHLAFIHDDSQRSIEAWRDLEPTLKIVNCMRPYWRSIDGLWSRISILLEVQLSKISSLKDTDGRLLSSVSRLAEQKRDVGKLTEPLADSVLRYGTRHIRSYVPMDSNSPGNQVLETILSTKTSAEASRIDEGNRLALLTPTGSSPSNLTDNRTHLDCSQQSRGTNSHGRTMNELDIPSDFIVAEEDWQFDPQTFIPSTISYLNLLEEATANNR